MKKVLLIILLTTLALSVFSQEYTVTDFFIPKETVIGVRYEFMNKKTGAPDRDLSKERIYYKPTWSDNYQVLETTLMGGEKLSSSLSVIAIKDNEVLLREVEHTSSLMGNSRDSYPTPQILFKLPEEGKTTTWTTPGKKNDPPTKHTASWTTIKVEDKDEKTIKVVSLTQDKDWKMEEISYYGYKIGLFKVGVISKGKENTTYRFKEFIENLFE